MNSEIKLVHGNIGFVDDIQDLWEGLKQLHIEKSLDFEQYYRDIVFSSRKESFVRCAENGELLILIAYHDSNKVGYCVASVVDGTGEIDSIFVRSDYRKKQIGNMLIESALDWIHSCSANKIIVKVATGNEEVFGFYSKYGFAPRLTEMQLLAPGTV